jgi:CheY-like chemotaxis protein
MNLAVNARDAMPQGGVLTIETANAEVDQAFAREHAPIVPGPYVQLAVADDGVGMDESVREHLFEPFFTTKPEGTGSGLGLSTIYGIVKQSGGYIWVYSEPGKGATFRVYLPRAAGEQPGAPVAPVLPSGGSETILLVEDDLQLRHLTRRVLERHGYTVLDAESPDHALSVAARHGGVIELLLTDVVMPGGSGRDLAERMLGERPRLRVLYMSGYSDEAIVRYGVLTPGTEFLQKPATAGELLQKVRAALDR